MWHVPDYYSYKTVLCQSWHVSTVVLYLPALWNRIYRTTTDRHMDYQPRGSAVYPAIYMHIHVFTETELSSFWRNCHHWLNQKLSIWQLISPYRRIYASMNWVSIGSGNGLSPVRRQAITRTNADILSIGPLGTKFNKIWIEILTFSLKKCVWKCFLWNGGRFDQEKMS